MEMPSRSPVRGRCRATALCAWSDLLERRFRTPSEVLMFLDYFRIADDPGVGPLMTTSAFRRTNQRR